MYFKFFINISEKTNKYKTKVSQKYIYLQQIIKVLIKFKSLNISLKLLT